MVVTAMGDADSFSCSTSPASSPYALSVGAIDAAGIYVTGTNYGGCVDMYAPGEDIPAPWIGASNTEARVLTGTSASAAIVTGVVANMMSSLRSPSWTYTNAYRKIPYVLYNEIKELINPDDYTTFIRNIMLTPVDYQRGSLCLIRYDISEESYVYKSAVKMLTDVDTRGRPSAFKRLKSNRAQKQSTNRQKYY